MCVCVCADLIILLGDTHTQIRMHSHKLGVSHGSKWERRTTGANKMEDVGPALVYLAQRPPPAFCVNPNNDMEGL